jgi:uncharacterized phiE125 gp8 family phage protein
MKCSLIIPPTAEPVSLAEAKAHLRIDLDLADDDLDLEAKLSAARMYVEQVTNRALVKSTWELILDAWPRERHILMPKGKLDAVESITYTDASGAHIAMPATDYEVDAVSDPGRVVLATEASWPAVALRASNGIAIRFVAGWEPAEVPAPVRLAVLMLAGHWYRHREAVTESTNRASGINAPLALAVNSLLASYRIRSFG